MYTISDLVRKHTANKATEHYRFGQEHDESEAKSTYDAGPGTLDEESDSNRYVKLENVAVISNKCWQT